MESSTEWLTMEEVAGILRVDPRSVRRWAAEDASFPATRLGPRLVRVERQALEAWLVARTQRPGRRRPANTAPAMVRLAVA